MYEINILNSYNIIIFLAGALGALLADLLKDNALELPKKIDGKLFLGFFGGMIAGGFAGVFIDGSIETAFMGGYVGKEILMKILTKKVEKFKMIDIEKPANPPAEAPTNETIEQMIRRKACEKGVDENLAVAVARCESGLRADAVNVNTNGTRDRGIYQWNDYWHPKITDEMAFNPEKATDLFLDAVLNGNLSWWNASKKCWEKCT